MAVGPETPHRPVHLKSIEWVDENLCRVTFHDDERGLMETIYEVRSSGSLTHRTRDYQHLLQHEIQDDPLWLENNWTMGQHRALVTAVTSFCLAAQGQLAAKE